MTYTLARRCEDDLRQIYRDGAARFDVIQAERYQNGLRAAFHLLAENPRMARERTEFRRPVRLHPFQAHLIMYVLSGDGILILRVFHGREEWARRLQL